MTKQEELAALEEEYDRPWPPGIQRITRRASRRKEVLRNRINELRRELGLLRTTPL
jgi:hypothetical protein